MNTAQATSMTSGEYIQHHLEHLTVNLDPAIGNSGFWSFNIDTLVVSVLMALL